MYPFSILSLKPLLKMQLVSLLLCSVLLLAPKAMALELGNVEMHDVNIKSSTAGGALKSFMSAIIEQGVKQARTKAEAGDAKAQNTLGEAYQKGQGVPQSNEKAAKWFKLAAAQENAAAEYHLSLMYQAGIGVTHDANKALQLLHKAAEQDHAQAQYRLATHYLKEKDMPKYLRWLEISANNDYPQAINKLGFVYSKGELIVKDDAKAFSLFQRAAKAGNAAAMNNLSWCYLNGAGVERDDEQGDFWLTKAAEKGLASAQYVLGVSQGYNISWITKSAEQGYPDAQYRLGMMYISGEGAEEHASKGFYWLVRAQGSGSEQAEYILNKTALWVQEQLRNLNKEQSK